MFLPFATSIPNYVDSISIAFPLRFFSFNCSSNICTLCYIGKKELPFVLCFSETFYIKLTHTYFIIAKQTQLQRGNFMNKRSLIRELRRLKKLMHYSQTSTVSIFLIVKCKNAFTSI